MTHTSCYDIKVGGWGVEHDGVQWKVAVRLKSKVQGKHMKPHFTSTSL